MGRTCPIQSDPAGGGHSSLSGTAGFGDGTTAGTCFLALLYARDSENRDCFWGEGRAVEAQWLQSLCPNLPIETTSLTLQASPNQVTGTYLNSNHSQICHPVAEETAGCQALCSPGTRIQFYASCTDLHSEGAGAHMYLLPVCGRNHSLQVGKSSVQLAELKQATPVAGRLSSPTFKIYGPVAPRWAGIFYR